MEKSILFSKDLRQLAPLFQTILPALSTISTSSRAAAEEELHSVLSGVDISKLCLILSITFLVEDFPLPIPDSLSAAIPTRARNTASESEYVRILRERRARLQREDSTFSEPVFFLVENDDEVS